MAANANLRCSDMLLHRRKFPGLVQILISCTVRFWFLFPDFHGIVEIPGFLQVGKPKSRPKLDLSITWVDVASCNVIVTSLFSKGGHCKASDAVILTQAVPFYAKRRRSPPLLKAKRHQLC